MTSTIVVRLPSPAHDRVIRVTNVHFAADSKAIAKFFNGYAILDQYRTTNVRIGTKSVVYVLFATVADKIRSFELSRSMLFDREIKIQPAPHGNYTLNDDETGFVKPVKGMGKGKDAATAAGPSNVAATFEQSDFPALGTPQEKDTPKSLPAIPVASLNVTDRSSEEPQTTLPDALEDMTLGTDEHIASTEQGSDHHERAESSVAAPEAEEAASHDATMKRKAKKAYGLTSYDTTSGPFGRKASHIATDGDNTAKNTNHLRTSPPIVHMPIPATYDNWNLNGHDAYDRSKNILTPSDWYGFQAKQVWKTEQEQETEETNADRIIAVPAEGETEKGAKGKKRGGKK